MKIPQSLKIKKELLQVVNYLAANYPQFMDKTLEQKHAYAMIMLSSPGEWFPGVHVPTLRDAMKGATSQCRLPDGNVYFYIEDGKVQLYNPNKPPLDLEKESITFSNQTMFVCGGEVAEAFTLESLFMDPLWGN